MKNWVPFALELVSFTFMEWESGRPPLNHPPTGSCPTPGLFSSTFTPKSSSHHRWEVISLWGLHLLLAPPGLLSLKIGLASVPPQPPSPLPVSGRPIPTMCLICLPASAIRALLHPFICVSLFVCDRLYNYWLTMSVLMAPVPPWNVSCISKRSWFCVLIWCKCPEQCQAHGRP